jgi:hypothetical protein
MGARLEIAQNRLLMACAFAIATGSCQQPRQLTKTITSIKAHMHLQGSVIVPQQWRFSHGDAATITARTTTTPLIKPSRIAHLIAVHRPNSINNDKEGTSD